MDRIRLHEYAAGSRSAPVRPVRARRRSCVVVDGRVERVEAGRVRLTGGRSLSAPHVLVAVGSAARSGVGADHEVASLAGAAGVLASLRAARPGTRVTVRGGGLTGIEAAAEIAEAQPHVRVDLVDPAGPGGWLSAQGRRHVESTLTRLGVRLSGDAAGGGSAVGRGGAAGRGSAADEGGATGRGSAADEGGAAAQCISLGRRDGLIAWADPQDRMTGRIWTGRRAAWAKETVCRLASAGTHRGVRLYRWPQGIR